MKLLFSFIYVIRVYRWILTLYHFFQTIAKKKKKYLTIWLEYDGLMKMATLAAAMDGVFCAFCTNGYRFDSIV